MFNHLSFSKLERLLRRHWLVALCIAGLVGILWMGAPAWASPVTRPLNQTVPEPTPTSEGNPIATATPRPDEADDDDSSDDESDNGSTAPEDSPNIVFPQEPDGSPTPSQAAPVATAGATPQPADQTLLLAEQPLAIDFVLDPYFVWQGITATLTITVNNPNTVDASQVVLSDELPEALALVDAVAGTDGTVEIVTTTTGRTLLLFRWETVPAGAAATAIIVAVVSPELADGTVIDNLVATRGSNVVYGTDAVTIGMPPVVAPDFQ